MGSAFNYYKYNGSKEDIYNDFSEHQEEECHANGSDTYAGHLGTLPGLEIVAITPFAEMRAARNYIEENHSKWEAAMAVPYKGEVSTFDAVSKKVLQQRKALEKEILDMRQKFLKSMKSTKSKTIGCKRCGSSIGRRYLYSAQCPVCSKKDAFYSNTQISALAAKKKRLAALLKKSLNKIKKSGPNYVIGGWCPE
jgi:hypothetical protein